jgi:hypothetical protein
MKWGTHQIRSVPALPPGPITTNTQTINYPSGATIPVFTAAAYSIMITDNSADIGDDIDPNWHVYLKSLGAAANFTIRVYRRTASNEATSPIRFNWLAIGPGV